MISAVIFFFARTAAVFDLIEDVDRKGNCDELRITSGQVFADKTFDILRVRVRQARNLENEDGTINGFSDPYAMVEYETYYLQTVAVQTKRTKVAHETLGPNWVECNDVYFPIDFLIKDPENDKLRVSVYDHDTYFGPGDRMGWLELDVKELRSLIPKPGKRVPTFNRLDLEYRYSRSSTLYSVVMWNKLQGTVSGSIQIEVSLVPSLSWWSSQPRWARRKHIYQLPPAPTTGLENFAAPRRPRSTRPGLSSRPSKNLAKTLKRERREQKNFINRSFNLR